MTGSQPLGASTVLLPGRRSVLRGIGAVATLPGVAWGLPASTLGARTFSTPRHRTHYLEAGPADGPLMMFLHGWPELSLIWRSQMEAFAIDGWHCIAPDMRGYGGSSRPNATGQCAQEQIVADMAELHDHLGGKPAIWVGHDWGSVVVGSLAGHEPRRARGVVLVSVPYFPGANALPTLVPLVDRTIYPAREYPDGQWDYYRYYNTHFDAAVADLNAEKSSSLASIFRRGDPASVGKPASNATVTRKGGRFGAEHRAPPTQPDPALWPPADFDAMVRSFEAHGFRAPCAWYLNDDTNITYARTAPNGGRLSLPVLFVNGDYDQINTINGNRLGDPMRAACADLTVQSLPGAHWLPLECKADLTATIRTWLHHKKL
ncbi:alpha/beta hydrolase [Methylocystis sp. SB2]|uniref:alpha/beta hydrolase n=1 Tax=Methylocystis sp. (strain SB2) TaxID=743836 RepID=UPI001EFAE8DC|nr:alpha/beta hydrolase [Methylocystis sp. SB2]ULO23757.1 alpha/beta hydrolase [Methylocystis sp. SB2]